MDRDVQLDDMPQMRYAEQCIRETMRLLPTVPIIGRVISEPTEIGQFVGISQSPKQEEEGYS
jgi:cytochrome P450